MSTNMSGDVCILCKEGFDEKSPQVTVKQKGLNTLLRVSKEHDELEELSRFHLFIY